MSEAKEFADAMLLGLSYGENLEKILLHCPDNNKYSQKLKSELTKAAPGKVPQWALDEIMELLKQQLPPKFDYIIGHTMRVRNLGLSICPPQANQEAVEFAALFHDIAKADGEEVHTQHGADIASRWMRKNEFPGTLASKVAETILEAPNPNMPEAKVIWDASNLDKIGITGVAMLLIKAYHQGISVDELADLYGKSAPFIMKHRKIKADQFKFDSSCKLAAQRIKLMDDFFKDV